MNNHERQKRLHYDVTNVGLRAQATAVGLIQICMELRRANVLDEEAISRVKRAIGDELVIAPYHRMASREKRAEIDARLDRLFAGEEKVGSANKVSFSGTSFTGDIKSDSISTVKGTHAPEDNHIDKN